jgi:tetratricopeptide (TPR) repeat protein
MEKRWLVTFMLIFFVCLIASLNSIPGPFAAEKVNYVSEMYFCLGVDKMRNELYDDSHRYLTKAINLKPEYGDAHAHFGYLHIIQERHEEGIKHLKKAIEINPDMDFAHLELGNILFKLGQNDDAIFHFKQAVLINPINADYRNKLATALCKENRAEEAVQHFNKALEMNPTLYVTRYNLSIALLQIGKTGKALEELRNTYFEARRRGDKNMMVKIDTILKQIDKNEDRRE